MHQLLFKVLACGPRHGVPLRGVSFMFRFVHEISEWARSALGRGRCLCSLYLRLWPGVRVVVRKVVRRHSSCCISAPLSCGYFLRTHRGGSGWAGGKSSAVSPDLGILIRHWGTSALFSTVPHRFFSDPAPIATADHLSIAHPRLPRTFFWWGVADAGEKSLWALFASSGGFLTPLPPPRARNPGLSATRAQLAAQTGFAPRAPARARRVRARAERVLGGELSLREPATRRSRITPLRAA